MKYWKNLSLKNIVEEIDGVVYEEKWKDILDYEGIYKASDFGRIKALKRISPQNKPLPEKIKAQGTDKDGYKLCVLSKDGIGVSWRVHRLVCMAFYGIPHKKKVVNHKNGIKHDNRVKNLEWCTISENTQHSYANGFQVSKPPRGPKHPNSHIVEQYDKNGKLINSFIGVREAERKTGFDRCTIMYSHDNNSINKYGHKWKVIKRKNYQTLH